MEERESTKEMEILEPPQTILGGLDPLEQPAIIHTIIENKEEIMAEELPIQSKIEYIDPCLSEEMAETEEKLSLDLKPGLGILGHLDHQTRDATYGNKKIKRAEKLTTEEEHQLEEAAEAVVKASLAIDEARLTVYNIATVLDKLAVNSDMKKEVPSERAMRSLAECAKSCEDASLAIEEMMIQSKSEEGGCVGPTEFIKVEQTEDYGVAEEDNIITDEHYDDGGYEEENPGVRKKRKFELEDTDLDTKDKVGLERGQQFICAICQFQVADAESFSSHMQLNHQVSVDMQHSINKPKRGLRKKFKKIKGTKRKLAQRGGSSGDTLFSCDQCEYTCSSKLNLTVHQEKHAGVQHKCDECKFTTESITSLKKHYKLNHEADAEIKCADCNYITRNKYSYKKHVMRQHSNQMYYCDNCDYSTKHSNLLKEHRESKHEGLTHPCPHCDHVSTLKRNLKLHIEAVHKHIKYPCEYCDYKASQKQTLKFHIERKHSDVKYYCDECPFSAATIVNLRVHKYRAHQEEGHTKASNPLKMHKCEECDYATHIKGNLVNHMRKHRGEILYCDQCSYSTWNPPSLKQHVLKNHSSQEFKCDKCETVCPNEALLQKHKEVKHLGVTYTCEQCDFSTPHKYYLSRHKKKAHTEGVTKYMCERCDFTALYPSDLKVHTDAVHDGVRYPCSHCEFTAPRRGDLNKHIRKVHEGLPDGKIYKTAAEAAAAAATGIYT